MSNVVWSPEKGWHDGPEIPRAELVHRFCTPRDTYDYEHGAPSGIGDPDDLRSE